MKKHYILVAGMKFYADEKGLLLKDDAGNYMKVADSDTEAKEVKIEDSATAEVRAALETAVKSVRSSASKSLGEAEVEAIGAVEKMLKGIAAAANKAGKLAVEGAVKASYDVEKVKAGLKALSEGQSKVFTFSIKNKAELDFLSKAVSEADSLTGDVIEPQRVPEVTRDPVRTVFIESIADVIPNMTSNALSYVECVNESGAPLPTAELAEIQQKDFEFQEFKAPLKKIAVINKHSVEILKDAPQLVAAIKQWLNEDVNIVVDNQLLSGSGVGDELPGIFGVASVLDSSAVGTKRVAFANLADVIRVALTKVAVAGKGKFIANYVLLNPEDADALDLTKDENGQYVLPPFRSADGNVIKGARIIENVGVPAGEFLVGDFRKLHIGTQGGVEIEMTNSDGNDFSHDILSVKLRRRIAAYVRQNDNGAFWTGDIADVIAALTQS